MITYDDIIHNINTDQYRRPWDPTARNGRGSYVGEAPRDFQKDLFDYARSQGITNEKAMEAMYSIAYEERHGDGYHDVLYLFDDLLDIGQAYEKPTPLKSPTPRRDLTERELTMLRECSRKTKTIPNNRGWRAYVSDGLSCEKPPLVTTVVSNDKIFVTITEEGRKALEAQS